MQTMRISGRPSLTRLIIRPEHPLNIRPRHFHLLGGASGPSISARKTFPRPSIHTEISPLRSPGFPVESSGVAHLHAVSFIGNRTRGPGWSLSGIATLQSGFPLSPQLGYNPTGNGDTRNPVRPNRAPGFQGPLYSKTVKQWFNPAAFTAPYLGTFGDLARDTLTGPGLSELDLSVAKSTTIREGLRAQFRAEFFNVLNHSNFTTPNPVVYSSGPTPKTPTVEAQESPTAGVISSTATTSRQIQFGLKLLF
jgi:hypothetical protein